MVVDEVGKTRFTKFSRPKSRSASKKRGRRRSQRKQRVKTKIPTKNIPPESDKLETLSLEVQDLKSTVLSLKPELRRLTEVSDSLESQLADLKDYSEKRMQGTVHDLEELDSKIEEARISIERLSRDFERLLEERVPIRKIRMPPPITSQLTFYEGEEPLAFQLGVAPGVLDAAMECARSHVGRKDIPDEEVVGVLTGRVVGNTIVIEEAVAGRTSYSGLTGVALDPKNLAEIVDAMVKDGRYRSIVGWYHSHLGLGVFLSDVDVKTQLTLQQFTYVIALVVDPTNDEHGFFYVDKNAKLSDGRPKIVRFVKKE